MRALLTYNNIPINRVDIACKSSPILLYRYYFLKNKIEGRYLNVSPLISGQNHFTPFSLVFEHRRKCQTNTILVFSLFNSASIIEHLTNLVSLLSMRLMRVFLVALYIQYFSASPLPHHTALRVSTAPKKMKMICTCLV